ncbi:MAG: GH3 auxin-responsive promoter family protein [Bacteroidaceae bacterium]|nr:GH3 auxin-responsive promoter family protein [Bacteroidaceae bacterium]
MKITGLISKVMLPRQRALQAYDTDAESLQMKQLKNLVAKACCTEWGVEHDYHTIRTYEEYAKRVPIQSYDDIKPYVERMRHGAQNVLWPSQVKWYAKSSGTTNDKSKFIPVSAEGLKHMHYMGPVDCVAYYLQTRPDSRFFDGKGVILGGSHAPNYNLKDSLVGDLSAILIENMNPMANFLRVPDKQTALLSDFEEKMERIARSTIHKNITNISGVPSWMMALIKRVLEITGAQSLDEVWPNLEVFFHGGVSFAPYRETYQQLIRGSRMQYRETYNASEGFFGVQNDPSDPSMMLMLDYGVFYEFIPMEELGKENPHIVPLTGIELGRNYAVVISNMCGLWRYLIGDTVRFTSKNPYKFVISGRTKHFINAFGEELVVENAEKGLQAACAATGAQVSEYTAAPVFMDTDAKCRHQWLIEFAMMPDSIEHFAQVLDETLQQVNSDYEAKRYKDITLQLLEVVPARPNLFHDWLKAKGKLGGQHKVPRLSNTREYIDEMLTFNK